MKQLILLLFISGFVSTSAYAGDFYSAKEAAKEILDKNCGGPGELVSEEQVDEDYDYALYSVEMTNGTATVYAYSSISYDGNFYNDVVYEVSEYTCN